MAFIVVPCYVIPPQQTIKCLLIYPNPESALNEEAGKMLLEQYEDYSSRARMMTDIHAKPLRSASDTILNRMEGVAAAGSVVDGVAQVIPDRKRTSDKSSAAGVSEKKKKEKKKALKRL